MKKCIHQKKYCKGKIRCNYTGTIRRRCNLAECRYFYPTLRYRLFGK